MWWMKASIPCHVSLYSPAHLRVVSVICNRLPAAHLLYVVPLYVYVVWWMGTSAVHFLYLYCYTCIPAHGLYVYFCVCCGVDRSDGVGGAAG